jgi:hypothetical protein
MHFNEFNRQNIDVRFGPIATFATLALAAYGAGTAGTQVAQIVVKRIKKS